MKKNSFNSLIIAICLLLSGITTVHAEMNARDKLFYEQITEGSLRNLKNAAKNIHGGASRNVILLDTLAEVLWQLHPNAFDAQIDTLAWTARALGASGNGRYYDLLAEVSENGAHKKLRKHAKKALKELGGSQGEVQYKQGSVQIPKDEYLM